ncbi:MAG: adenylosuccinate synthase [Bacteroidales bacterium]|nr:adenylosuccinate synthase [Bacteroidales bacterium]
MNDNKVDVLLGLQWGDEGKGKVVDFLSEKYDVIARFHGGANAGHTLKIGNMTHVLHLIPSGIFHSDKLNIIGSGVVIDPYIFKHECDDLHNLSVKFEDRLLIAKRAHLILPTHRMLDAVYESSKGANKIGSTLKGIGPAYTDKVARLGLRVGDIKDEAFQSKYEALKKQHLDIAKSYGFDCCSFRIDNMTLEEYEKEWLAAIEYLKTLQLIDCECYINHLLDEGKTVLAEGAQGTMLDVDFGTYPFVTSSSSISSGVCLGLGVPPNRIGKIYGIAKAYCTRVGAGPFPTEQDNETGEMLRLKGGEYGATTGRPRRCGWIDLVQLKYSIMINGVTDLIITKPDVLNQFDTIKACTSYYLYGKQLIDYPYSLMLDGLVPHYDEIEGWKTDLSAAGGYIGLPKNFKNYLSFIENYLNTKINVISVGPDRKETIFIE